ncbi:unnamed protein product [Cuscuta campestris]|uniref:Retrotransposon gag domain-containing protein n=1 Tax=Cuscuta campestris TaxID=132261 RepID=A0A484M8U1_9ASTE|nr:unnamed protein product [Cuscuta campestris]
MASHLGEDIKKSFLEVLGSANQPERFPSKQIEKFKGFPAISFAPNEVKSLSAPYEYALVGRFNKSRPPLHIIRSCLERIGFKVNLKIGLLSQSILFLNFKCRVDYQRCFSKRVWKINGSSMIVSKWSPDFHVDIESPIFPIWTSLPHLPVHLQEARALYSIAKCLGNPIMMDSSTSAKIRPSVARFCVEMDITQELPKKIWIDNGGHGFFQPVSYEDIPKYCRDCQKSGHTAGKCNTADDVFPKKDAATSTKANNKDPKPSGDIRCPIVKDTKITVQNSKADEDVLVTPLEQKEIAKEDMAGCGSAAGGTTPTTRGHDTSVQSSKNRFATIEKTPSHEGSSSIQPTTQLEVEETKVGTQHEVVEIKDAVTMVADAIEIQNGCSTPNKAAKISPDPVTAIEAKTATRHTYKETIIEVDGSKDEEPQEFAANDTFDASQDNEETGNQTEPEFDCEEYQYEEDFTLVKSKKQNSPPELTIQTRSGQLQWDKEDGPRKSAKLRLGPEMGRTSAMERLGGSRHAQSRRSRESEMIHQDEEEAESQPRASAYTRLSYDEDDLEKIGSVARKLRALEEKVEEKAGAKKHTLAKSPFSARVHAQRLRQKIKLDVEKFTGKEDPNVHLDTFHNAAQMAGCTDAEECLLFFSSLRGRPVEWFNGLPHGRIGSFEKLAEVFRKKYQDNCIKRKKFTYLNTVGQKEKESLTQFLTRWRDEVDKVEEMDDKTAMSLLMNAFRSGDLYTEFCRRPPSSYQEAYNTAWEYADAEVLNKSKRELEEGYTKVKSDKLKKDDQMGGSKLKATYDGSVHQIRDDKKGEQPKRPWTEKWCTYHQSDSHNTADCRNVKAVLKEMALKGELGEGYATGNKKDLKANTWTRPQGKDQGRRKSGKDNNNPDKEFIEMIVGGPEGGDTASQRKNWARSLHVAVVSLESQGKQARREPITFTDRDLPRTGRDHNDPLVITMDINGADVARVLVDTGSSVNVLYLDAFKKLKLDRSMLRPLQTPLSGFTGASIEAEGQITLPVTLGSGNKTVTKQMRFVVVDIKCVHNAILGRPGINQVRAIISMAHLCMKFYTPNGIGEERGDQKNARSCYLEAVKKMTRQFEQIELVSQQVDKGEEKARIEPDANTEVIQIDTSNPERKVKIGADLQEELRTEIVQVLTRIKSDSSLVVGHINGNMEAKGEKMQKYRDLARALLKDLTEYVMEKIPRGENTDADLLSKLTQAAPEHVSKLARIETLEKASIEGFSVSVIEEDGQANPDRVEPDDIWIDDLVRYYMTGQFPEDVDRVRKVKLRAPRFQMLEGRLYKRAFGGPLLRCLTRAEAERVIAEVHEGVCTAHQMSRTLAQRIILLGYFWPTMNQDCERYVQRNELVRGVATYHLGLPVTSRKATGETPFVLTYGCEARLPIEAKIMTFREKVYKEKGNEEDHLAERNLLEERRMVAEAKMMEYQQAAKAYHDNKVGPRYFQVGDEVLRRRGASKPGEGGKLAKKWEGPYRVTAILRPGTYKLETMEGRELERCWNSHHLRKFYR